MLRNRLYYAQPACKAFTAQVMKEELDEHGKVYVMLNQTAFYPTGGGQPHDTGTINGIEVVDVVEINGEIRHYLAESIEGTEQVDCVINWARRFDHMQQHAGQHILSAAFVEQFEISTVSFHLGKDLVSIDIEVDEISTEQLNAVENLANQVILENRPIEVKWVTEDELANYPLRKKVQAEGEIRLVIIPDFDYNGCGGTHPTSTGQVSALKILSTEKHRGQTRVYFVCGKRVLQQLHTKTTVIKEATQLLSAPEEEIGQAIEKLLTASHSFEKTLKETEEKLLQFEAKELKNQQQGQFITATFEDRSIKELQKLARLIVAEADDAIIFLVAKNEDKIQFVAAKGKQIEDSMKKVSSAVLPAINGKGGGSDAFVQGGGDATLSTDALVQMMKESL